MPKSRVRIDQRRWNRTLVPILAQLRADLGLPEGYRLKAQMHSLLVYAPGQFFLPHQDSEKSDTMVGTLTVTLPGSSRGGSLVVQHGDVRATYRSSHKALSFVAFYSDCLHEVRPVTSGYPVVLTYNLMLAGDATFGRPAPADLVANLAACLDEHFAEQNRLVYLLDHQYTTRGFSWSRLKGVDAERVSALRSAAHVADCKFSFALADVHETWSCFEPYDGRGHSGDQDEEFEVEDLLDRTINLDAWFDPSGAPTSPLASAVGDAEVCATKPTAKFAPYESEYEGYLGNYGNTLDRWYRRAAIVMWPSGLDFAVRGHGSPGWALDRLAVVLGDDAQAHARELVESLASFWMDAVRMDALQQGPTASGQPEIGQAMLVAGGLADARLATMLLRPFRLELLTPSDAPALVALAREYGQAWIHKLLTGWDRGSQYWYRAAEDRRAWLVPLQKLCRELNRADGAPVTQLLLTTCRQWLADAVGRARALTPPSTRTRALDELAAPTAGLLLAAAVSDASDLGDAMVSVLTDGDDVLLHCVLKVVHMMSEAAPGQLAHSGFEALRQHARRRLESRLAQPPRQPDDWTIDVLSTCSCQLCTRFDAFLADPTVQALDWPLAEQGRRHVHDRIIRYELPVRHETRRLGRPYTLVLTKMRALFSNEMRARQADEAELRWLKALPAVDPDN